MGRAMPADGSSVGPHRRFTVAAALVTVGLAGAVARAETISWELFEFGRAPGKAVLASGVQVYSPASDVVVVERNGWDGEIFWDKSVALTDDFSLTLNVHRDTKVDGFSLAVDRRSNQSGFSWNWFNRKTGNVFEALHGAARVVVTTSAGPGYEEIASSSSSTT